MDSFFKKNGTLQGLMEFANAYNVYQGSRSSSATSRMSPLGAIVQTVMSLLGLSK